MKTDDVVSINQAAKSLGIDRATVYRWITRGTLRPVLFGGVQYILRGDIERLNKEMEEKNKKAPVS